VEGESMPPRPERLLKKPTCYMIEPPGVIGGVMIEKCWFFRHICRFHMVLRRK
jgi:hypothetical protein